MPQSLTVEDAREELLAALKDISSAHTLVHGVFAALPSELHYFGADVSGMLQHATERLTHLYLAAGAAPCCDPQCHVSLETPAGELPARGGPPAPGPRVAPPDL